MGDGTVSKPKPDAALQGIGRKSPGIVFMSQATPRYSFEFASLGQTKKSLRIGYPEIPLGVFGDTLHVEPRNARNWNKSVLLQVAEFAEGGDPDSPARILIKRLRRKPVKFSVSGNLPVVPPVQARIGGNPNAAIPVGQDRPDNGIGQALFLGERGHSKVTKSVEALPSGYPNIAFAILKERFRDIATKAVRLRKRIGPSLVYMHKASVEGSDP